MRDKVRLGATRRCMVRRGEARSGNWARLVEASGPRGRSSRFVPAFSSLEGKEARDDGDVSCFL